ncbi:YfhO family protein [Bacillus sp. B-jedd]|uniref:YfhO family protein n=1 Tax=Bacillus sp. B-jedd TaxID=1476857 RepID=UPI00051561E4|nr:YfhO family protein [Bacillus sp. B-jedd]CEG29092.1 multidrug resistance protein B [Bacillus sp. B-jedd]
MFKNDVNIVFRKKIDPFIIILALIVIFLTSIIFYRIFEKGYFFVSLVGDMREQYIHFFNLFHSQIRNGELPFWTWNYGPGGSFWNEFGYYMLGDVFIWPLLLLPQEWFPYSFIPMTIIKIYLISLGTYLLLRKIGTDKKISLTAGIISSLALFNFDHFYTHYFFLNSAVYFPFILLGYERYASQKKFLLLFFMLFLAGISNFYFMFINTLGLIFYILFRYFLINRAQKSFKDFWAFHFRIVGIYLLALGSAMIIFLPSVISLFQSNAFHRPDVINFDNVLGINDLIKKLIWQGGMNFLPLLMLPLFFINGKKYIPHALISIFLFVVVTFQEINRIVGGLSSPYEFRSFFIINTLMIVLAAIALDEINFTKKRNMLVLVLLSTTICFWLEKNPFTHYANIIKYLPIVFALAFIVSQFVGSSKKKYFSLISSMVLIFYPLMLSYSLMNDLLERTEGKDPGSYHKGVWGVLPLMKKSDYENLYNNEKVKYALGQLKADSDFYRINTSDSEILANNSSMTYNYKSFYAYNSMLKWKLQEFEMDFLAQPGSRRLSTLKSHINNTFLNTILNNKYHISFKDKHSNLYGYTPIFEKNGIIIEKNAFYLPFGFMYSSALPDSMLLKYDADLDEVMFNNATVSDSVFKKYNLETKWTYNLKTLGSMSKAKINEATRVKKNNGKLFVDSNKPIEILIPVQKHPESELTLYANIIPYTKNDGITMNAITSGGKNLVFEKNMRYNQYDLYQYHHEDTTNKVLFRFGKDRETEWVKLVIQPGRFLIKDINVVAGDYSLYKKKVKEYQNKSLKDLVYGNNFVKGNYKSEENSILFLSIPYSKGWKAQVDGNNVEIFPVHSTYSGIFAPKGEHKIYLNYKPEGFIIGGLISFLSIFILSFNLLKNRYIKIRRTKLRENN